MSPEFTSPFDIANPLALEIIANPYPSYHQLRAEDPVHWSETLQTRVLTPYPDLRETFRDRRMSANRMFRFEERLPEPMREKMAPILRIFSNTMLISDPPRHTRLRSLANKAFTPRVVEGMRSHIQAIVDQALDGVESTGRMDVISDLAYPLPVTVICEMLGVAKEDQDQFKRWTNDLATFLGNIRNLAEIVEVAQRSALDMTDYLRGIIRECRQNPRDDLISALVAA
ncbi:MAG: cytochrome P450, partial [Chloroflexi bacterium]|nr:cytochrome P450 [Chloroflexota bacterium]